MKPISIFVFGLFLLTSACKKEDTTPTVYLTPLEESFLSFPLNTIPAFGNYLIPPQRQFTPQTIDFQRGLTAIYQGSDTMYEKLSVKYDMDWLYPYYLGPSVNMTISVRNKKLIVNFHVSDLMSADEYSTYELNLETAQPAFETLEFKDRVFNNVYILENTNPGNFIDFGDVYYNKDFGIVAFYHGNKFTYLKN